MEQSDRRVQRTHQLMERALMELAEEKGYAAVTIKDITDRANVAYITFFRHYKDKNELLLHMLEQIIKDIEQMTADFAPAPHHETEGRLIFEHATANRAFYRILLSQDGTTSVYRRVRDMIATITLGHLKGHIAAENTDEPAIPLAIATNHVAASLLALIEWWLEQDMPYPPQRMADIYVKLILVPSLPSA